MTLNCFFPSEARNQEKIDHLVEDMIGGEHALRALTPYGELLLFEKLAGRIPIEMLLMEHFQSDTGDVVNDRAPTKVDAQVMTTELGKGKRIKRQNAKLDDYV
ncbi:hypothetical protein KY290_020245 [Solanum tuberosum]|uniref:Uncharacterized protein n=1 Tax=Solanum tuberosum TaxID=4113 RepID=A0ABQ7UY65_SOLTU|nr:hypothetical protein KY289_019401 [Solanum tuberosum]KAH0756752.1 hypothetical protein KY290_020245 [Solanum tuberosum]